MTFSRQDWIWGLFLVCAVIVFGNGLHYVLFRLLRRQQTEMQQRTLGIRKHLARPARVVLLTIGCLIILPNLSHLPDPISARIEQLLECLLVVFVGWLAIGVVYVLEAFTLGRFDTTVADNLRARRVHTQMHFIRRALIGLVLLLDLGMLLWSLHDERLWKFGTGILASAGLASILLAMAAKSTASNLIAGLQIALTEPIRIDDVVVIEGEWGRIESITSTYVTVKIWDQRNLVIPLSYFLEHPFQNWTRNTSDLMGTAFLYVDYTAPVELLREELARIVRASPLWDGRVCGLQVTNLTERTMELRCLVSSADSGENFDLRCLVREKMLEYMRNNCPEALPSARLAVRQEVAGSGEAASSLLRGPVEHGKSE